MPPQLRYPGSEVAVVGALYPTIATSASSVASNRVQMGDFHSYMAVISVGSISTTLTGRILKYDVATGGTGEVVAGTEITAITGTGDNRSVVIEFDGEQFDTSFRWFELELEPTTSGSSIVSGLILGVFPRYDAAFESQSGDVAERIVV